MYPYPLFWEVTLYEILIVVGFIGAIVIYRLLCDRDHLPAEVLNLGIYGGEAGLIGGYCIAVAVQAFYNYMETGVFSINRNTGATFYGGLLGGAALFLAVYFGVGHFVCRGRENIRHFWRVSDFAMCGIAFAHGMGRIGCLMAGCCYGKTTDSVFGIYMVNLHRRVIPVQLYEAIFLFLLAALLIVRCVRGKSYCMPLYMSVYGVWRFLIEYLRGDDRGATVVPFLTPSQLIAVVLIVGAAVVYYFERRSLRAREGADHAEA